MFAAETLAAWVADARARTLELVADLSDAQLLGPRLAIVNPLLWEIGHVAWFQELWGLRHALGEAPLLPGGGDHLYDSGTVPHDTRWDLPLPSRAETLAYLTATRDRVLSRLPALDERARYFVALGVFHEDMHDEAFTYTRRTHGFGPARTAAAPVAPPGGGPLPGDVQVPGGTYLLGARAGAEPFVFDNEKWAHPVEVAPFAIARAPVTCAELAAFVADGGYRRRELWSQAGWRWREQAGATAPLYPIPAEAPHRAALHVGWFEAEAYCRWAGRRLPAEVEWEVAALGHEKRRFPWGDTPPAAHLANLDGRAGGPIDVGSLAEGDSPFGCRQMIGNVWEWTASDFGPYPGFLRDPYQEYSEPWFGTHKVLRGGCWATRGRLLRGTWRNFYTPDRRDVFAGFRTCARA